MNYQEFIQNICQSVQDGIGFGAKITVQDIVKNNDTHLDGLTILTGRSNLSPTIYLNGYYREYEEGRDLSDICQEIINIYHENRPSGDIDITFFTDYDKVKSKIVFKLVNYNRNRQLLENVPHYRFLDLAVVFYCLLEASP